MGESGTTERIGIARVDAAAATLAAAFSDDPIFLWLHHGRALASRASTAGFRSVLQGELRKVDPELYLADGEGGAAGSVSIWHGIDDWKGSTIESIRSLPAFARVFGTSLPRVFRTLATLEKVHPREPHYHLAYVGTHPDQQGRGLGTAVLAPMLERCDAEGVPAYLENSKPRNEAFYVRHGFVATGPIPLPDGAPPMMAMWREPRTA